MLPVVEVASGKVGDQRGHLIELMFISDIWKYKEISLAFEQTEPEGLVILLS